MTRTYTLRKRAEQQAETRRRIVQAAVDLHGSVGPAQTSLSMVAERAGVQRHTLYAHFPDERALLKACSALSLEQSPLPEADLWRSMEDRSERLRMGLGALYGWYERNAALAACVLRDAEHHAPTRETMTRVFGPYFTTCEEVLGAGLSRKQGAVLHLALQFSTWRALTRGSGLSATDAVDVMAHAIHAA
jgi:AcrR family transcriptional regulator